MNAAKLFFACVLLPTVAEASGIVAIDQAGYHPKGCKIAWLSTPADSFRVENVHTREIVLHAATHRVGPSDPATGLTVFRADFSSLQTPGRYCVRTSSGDSSFHFLIADTVYRSVLRAAIRSYYFQRCGTALPQAVAGPWWHKACHVQTDGLFHATAEGRGAAPAWGGWHDAGDYGKYIVNAGVSVGQLLMAYECFPGQFQTDDLQIPESGNGVPDLLDEVRYELDWFLKMQAADGGVYHKITPPTFEGFVMPDEDLGQRFIYQVSSAATADFAAAMARASRVFQQFDTAFAAKCLASALKAWNYLQVHPIIVPPGGFRNPPGTKTGEYGDNDDSDERLWAAAELSLATAAPSARAYFVKNYDSFGVVAGEISWRDVRTLAHCAYLLGSRDGIDTTIQETIRQSLLRQCRALLGVGEGNAFRNALPPDEYSWGSNSRVLNNGLLLALGRMEGGPEALGDAAVQQLHYILGANALSQSFVTGVGTRSPMDPHHRPSGSDGVAAPVPGLVVGGPNARIQQDAVLQARFSASTPPALCYADTLPSYASNETAINWNAPFVFLAAFAGGGPVTEAVLRRERRQHIH